MRKISDKVESYEESLDVGLIEHVSRCQVPDDLQALAVLVVRVKALAVGAEAAVETVPE
eukprot:SAG11_NODE_21659_length_421_cov_0.450311_1_plen_58_part_10